FRDCDHGGIMFLGDGDGVADVVKMPVRTEQDVHFFDVLIFFRAHGITHDPGIDHDRFAGRRFDSESCVSQPGKFHAIQIHKEENYHDQALYSSEATEAVQRTWAV